MMLNKSLNPTPENDVTVHVKAPDSVERNNTNQHLTINQPMGTPPGKEQMNRLFKTVAVCSATIFFAACGGPSEPKQPDLPEQPDRWVSSIELSADTSVKLIGETRDYLVTTVSSVGAVNGLQKISVGDDVEGIRIGAIRCSFHQEDASYGGKQFMWRGRWACMAGRIQQEVLNAVGPNGEKRHSYIHASPITIAGGN